MLDALSTVATALVDAAGQRDWDAAAANAEQVRAAWRTLRGDAPPMLADRVGADLRALTRGVRARRPARATKAALGIAQSTLDLELRHRPATDIDAARFDLRARRLVVDAAARDLAGVRGDVAVLEWMRDQFAHTLGGAGRAEVDARLRALRAAADARNLPAAADHAARLAARVRDLYRPPAMAGRITSTSDSPTDVSSPPRTRTSSSLR